MKQLHPKAVWLLFVMYLTRWLVLFFLFIYLVAPALNDERGRDFLASYWWFVLIIFFVLGIGTFIWAQLAYKFYRYELADEGFRKELGVIYKKYVTIPYDRIQNVNINRGIWARILGLSDLQIETAGGSGVRKSEGRLPGLSVKDAEVLRNELIHRARRKKTRYETPTP